MNTPQDDALAARKAQYDSVRQLRTDLLASQQQVAALTKDNESWIKKNDKSLLLLAKVGKQNIELTKELQLGKAGGVPELIRTLTAERDALTKERDELKNPIEKIAPVQGYAQGIPWHMHLRAYNAYCKRYGPQKALIEGWCRGGFGTSELDTFIPGWRDELDKFKQLQSENTTLLASKNAAESRIEELLLTAESHVCQIESLCQKRDDLETEKNAAEASVVALRKIAEDFIATEEKGDEQTYQFAMQFQKVLHSTPTGTGWASPKTVAKAGGQATKGI